MRRRVQLVALALALAGPSCGAAPSPPAPPRPAPERAPGASLLRPARYLVLDRRWIERTGDGIDRVVAGGRRLELRGVEIVAMGPADPEVDGGARAPAWAAGGAARYVFWKGKQLFGGEGFMGALHPIAVLPGEPRGSFDWLDGTGLLLPGGALVAPASGAAPVRTGVPALARAVAAGARRAVAVTALGHALLTLDGGASYRDVSADVGGVGAAGALEARGDAIAVVLPGAGERVVTASGAIRDGGPGLAPARGDEGGSHSGAPIGDPDPFLDATATRPIDAALRDGLLLPDGGVVIAAHGFVGRLDLATLHASSVAPLDRGLRDAECAPVRQGSAILLACVGPAGAAVVDLEGAPRTERTFDLAGAADLDRFVASGDDALGYLGPCDGTPPQLASGDLGPEGPGLVSHQRSPVFCVRAGRDTWVEHRLDPAEAAEVIAWIPRADGGAVALLARAGLFLDDRDRVGVRGALRVVRLARNEPPLAMSPYGFDRPRVVNRSLRALADDTIVGWLSWSTRLGGTLSVVIDASGHVRAQSTPMGASRIVHAGRVALAAGDDGRLWETVDTGQRWAEVDPPPGGLRSGLSCSPVGCLVGGFARLGWTDPPRPGASREEPRPRERYRRSLPPPPLLRLACAPSAIAEGRRIADSGGFGVTPQPQPRNGALTRIASLGVASIPWSGGTSLPAGGDVDLAWVAPLDLTGALRRLTLPVARIGLSPGSRRPYELHVGYLLAPDGGVEAFSTGDRECFGNLLEIAGVTRPLGACAEEPSVGVDLGGRVVVVHPASGSIVVSVAEAPRPPVSRRGPGAAFSVPVALHAIHWAPAGGPLRGFAFAAGSRGGVPVVVVVDDAGDASLAPIDPDRGSLGAEERLRPLSAALLGSAPACAPRSDGREARVVLPFEGLIGVDRTSLPGVGPGSSAGVAVLRWSPDRVCLDAVEIPVKDARYDESPGPYEPHGVLRKIVARFDRQGGAAPGALLLEVSPGTEVRQRLSCTALLAGGEEAP